MKDFSRTLAGMLHTKRRSDAKDATQKPGAKQLVFPIEDKQDRPRPIVPDDHDSDNESVESVETTVTSTTLAPKSMSSAGGDVEILRPALDGPTRASRQAGLAPFFESLLQSEKRRAPGQRGGPNFGGAVTEKTMATEAADSMWPSTSKPQDSSTSLSRLLDAIQRGNLDALGTAVQANANANANRNAESDEDTKPVGWKPIHYAAQRGSLKLCRGIIEKGGFVDVRDGHQRTALHMASQQGHFELCEYLIGEGARVNIVDERGVTPLNLAIVGEHLDVAELLLKHGADPNSMAMSGRSPLHFAAAECNPAMVRILLAHGANPALTEGRQWNALHLTTQYDKPGTLEVVRLILDTKAVNVNASQDNGATALHLAVQSGRMDVVELLLEAGADPNSTTVSGKSPLHFAATDSDVALVRLFLARGGNPALTEGREWNALHLAAQYDKEGTYEVVRMLLDTKTLDINAVQDNGATALHLAVQTGRLDIVEMLLEAGANPDLPTKKDVSSLERAVTSSNHEMVDMLIKHGADVKRTDNDGRGLAHIAALQEDVEIVRKVLEAGADPNLADKRLVTPLHLAVQNDKEEIALALMEFGALP